MRKILLSLLVLTLLNSCGNETKKPEEKSLTEKITSNELQKFNSVEEMLSEAGDFNEEMGTLKILDGNPQNPHFQVSKPIVKDDLDNVVDEIVKRDIVYVAFQTFAQTQIDKITITSIPIDLKDKTKYYDKFKKSVTINKKSADEIMKEEFGSDDYSILFAKSGTTQVPSREFDKLKFEKLEETFKKLK